MSEIIYKLQPNRTIHLRGFDRRGAAAAITEATETGFKVRGVFRDMADFAVVVLWDADDYFEDVSFCYLPDFDFTGMVLTFDLQYDSGLQPIDSPMYNWIDWATLDAIRPDGSTGRVKLFDYAVQQSGAYTKASGAFTLVDAGMESWDRVSLVPEFRFRLHRAEDRKRRSVLLVAGRSQLCPLDHRKRAHVHRVGGQLERRRRRGCGGCGRLREAAGPKKPASTTTGLLAIRATLAIPSQCAISASTSMISTSGPAVSRSPKDQREAGRPGAG